MAQSTNDAFAIEVHIAILDVGREMLAALRDLRDAFATSSASGASAGT